jgi:Zn-dependent peptidase ImmA (M78 family)
LPLSKLLIISYLTHFLEYVLAPIKTTVTEVPSNCSLDYEVEEKYEEESFCNMFSAEFLVPSYDIKKRVTKLSAL